MQTDIKIHEGATVSVRDARRLAIEQALREQRRAAMSPPVNVVGMPVLPGDADYERVQHENRVYQNTKEYGDPFEGSPGMIAKRFGEVVATGGKGVLPAAYDSTIGATARGLGRVSASVAEGTGLASKERADQTRAVMDTYAQNEARTAAQTPGGSVGSFVGPAALSAAMILATRTPASGAVTGAGLGIYGLSSADQGMAEYRATRQQQGKEANPWEELAVGAGYGAAEILFERIGLDKTGSAIRSVGQNMADAVLRRDAKALAQIAMSTAESVGVNMTEEGATQYAQNIIDSTFDPNQDINEGVRSSMIGGGLQGLMVAGPGGALSGAYHGVRAARDAGRTAAAYGGAVVDAIRSPQADATQTPPAPFVSQAAQAAANRLRVAVETQSQPTAQTAQPPTTTPEPAQGGMGGESAPPPPPVDPATLHPAARAAYERTQRRAAIDAIVEEEQGQQDQPKPKSDLEAILERDTGAQTGTQTAPSAPKTEPTSSDWDNIDALAERLMGKVPEQQRRRALLEPLGITVGADADQNAPETIEQDRRLMTEKPVFDNRAQEQAWTDARQEAETRTLRRFVQDQPNKSAPPPEVAGTSPSREMTNGDEEGNQEGRQEGLLNKQGQGANNAPIPDYADDIPINVAVGAFTNTSHTPEKRGQARREEYAATLKSAREELDKAAVTPEQKAIADAEFARYRDGMKRRMLDYLRAHSRVASAMITGPANFPTERNRKAGNAADKRLNELVDFDKRARAAMMKAVRGAATPEMMASEESARLEKRVQRFIDHAEDPKGGATSLFKSNLQGALERAAKNGETTAVANALRKLRDWQTSTGRTIFTNRSSIWKLADISEKAVEEAAAAPTGEQEHATYTDGTRVVRNYDDDRLRILFPGKPSDAQRTALKSRGFKWSPANGAWQRQNTQAAVYAADEILRGFGKQKNEATPAPAPKPAQAPAASSAPRETGAPSIAFKTIAPKVVRDRLKAAGFKFNPETKAWDGPQTDDARTLVETLDRERTEYLANRGATKAASATTTTAKSEPQAAAPAVAKIPKNAANATKLRRVADATRTKGEESLNRDRNANTARRARMADSAVREAQNQIAMADLAAKVADDIEANPDSPLANIGSMVQLQELIDVTRSAKSEAWKDVPESERDQYRDRDKLMRSELLSVDNRVLNRVGEASLPWINGSNFRDFVDAVAALKGGKQAAAKLARYKTYDGTAVRVNGDLAAIIRDWGAKLGSYQARQTVDAAKEYFRRAAITGGDLDVGKLRDAVKRLAELRNQVPAAKENPVAKLERSLVGQTVGIDFFPTPPAIAADLVDRADIRPGMRVLEPSAGNGRIADAIKAAGVEPDVVEVSSSLREILEAKGHNLVAQDFTEFKPNEKYDRIVMNPPFSNRMDVEHVRRAYEMLNPGGRIVAIMSEGPFFGSDKKAAEFREWLGEVGESEKLPPNSFAQDRTGLPTTSVAARIVTIDKPKTAAAVAPTPQPPSTPDPATLPRPQLVRLAKERGVDTKGTKKEIAERLKAQTASSPEQQTTTPEPAATAQAPTEAGVAERLDAIADRAKERLEKRAKKQRGTKTLNAGLNPEQVATALRDTVDLSIVGAAKAAAAGVRAGRALTKIVDAAIAEMGRTVTPKVRAIIQKNVRKILAESGGDPDFKRRAELTAKVRELEAAQESFQSLIINARRRIETLSTSTIPTKERHIATLESQREDAKKAQTSPVMELRGQTAEGEEAILEHLKKFIEDAEPEMLRRREQQGTINFDAKGPALTVNGIEFQTWARASRDRESGKTTVGYSVKHPHLYLGWGDVTTARGIWDRIREGLKDLPSRVDALNAELDKARADLAEAEKFVQTKFANEDDLKQARADLQAIITRLANKQNAQHHGGTDVQTLILGGLGVGPVSTGKPSAPQRFSERVVSVFNDYEQRAKERRRERARRMGGSMMLYTGVIPDPKRVAEAAGELADLVIIATARAVRANLREGRPLTKLVDETIAAVNPSAAPKAKQIRGWVAKLLANPDATEEGFDRLVSDLSRPFRTKGEARAAKRAAAAARKAKVADLTAEKPGNPVTVDDKEALATSLEQQAKAAGKVQNQAAGAIRTAIVRSFKAGTREGWAQAGVEIGALRGRLKAAKDWADVLQAMGKRTTKNAVKDHEAAMQELRGTLVEAAKKMPPKVAQKHLARIVKVKTKKQAAKAMVAMERTFLKLQIASITRETIKRTNPTKMKKMKGSTEEFRKAVTAIRNDAAGTRMVARDKNTREIAQLQQLLETATEQYEKAMMHITTARAAHQKIRAMQGFTAWQIAGRVAERIAKRGKSLDRDGHEDPKVGGVKVYVGGITDLENILHALEGPNGDLKRLLIDRPRQAQNKIGLMQRDFDEAMDRAAKRAGFANANEAWNAWASSAGRGVVKRVGLKAAGGREFKVTLGDIGGLLGAFSDPETRATFAHPDGRQIQTEYGRSTTPIDVSPAEIEAAMREHDPDGKIMGFIKDAKAWMERYAPEAFRQVYLAKGVEPVHVKDYWPRTVNLAATGAAKELETLVSAGDFMSFYAQNQGIFHTRTKSRAPLVTINPVTTWMNQSHDLTTAIAMTMPIRDAAMVLFDPRVKEAIVDKIGADRYRQIVNMLAASSEVQKVYEKPSAKWVASGGQNAAIMVLGTNLKSWLSNVVGHVRNMPFMPFAAWAAGAAHMAAHPMQNMEVLFDSGYFYRRYTKTNVSRHTNLLVNPMDADLEQRFMPELERALKNVAVGDYRAAYSHVRKASSRFLDLMGWFESRTALASYFGWKSYLASKHKDWSPARVHKAALARAEANIRETQNPSEVTDSAPTAIENRGTVLAPISWMQSDRFKAYARIRRGFARSTEQGLKVLAAEVLSSAMINVGGKRIWLLVALIAATAAGDESEKRRLRKEFDNFKGDGLDVLEDIASASAPVGGQFVARVFTSMFDPQRMSASRLGEAPGIPAVDALYRAGASSAAAWTALRQSWGRRSKRDDAAVALATALNDITGALGLNPLHSITSRVLRQLKKAAE